MILAGSCSLLTGLLPASETKPPKTLLWIFPQGGISQADSFDPKPDAPSGIRSEFGTISASVPGLRVGELFPAMARAMDRLTLYRARVAASLEHVSSTHQILQRDATETHLPQRLSRGMPFGFCSTPDTWQDYRQRVWNVRDAAEAVWDAKRQRYDLPDFGVPREGFGRRWNLLGKLDTMTGAEEYHEKRAKAKELLCNPPPRYRPTPRDLERYCGDHPNHPIGRGMLAARDMARSGIYRSVICVSGEWDHHAGCAILMKQRSPLFDRALSALVEDLGDLLPNTVLWVGSEFGRTPKINKAGGRDHYPTHFNILAGRGVEGGRVIGRTDRRGESVIDSPVSHDDMASIVKSALGIHSAA